jgi:hypothetical protein
MGFPAPLVFQALRGQRLSGKDSLSVVPKGVEGRRSFIVEGEEHVRAVALTRTRLIGRGQPDLVDFPLPQPGLDDHGRRDALAALVHEANDLERAGAVGLLPAEGPGVPGVPPADLGSERRQRGCRCGVHE